MPMEIKDINEFMEKLKYARKVVVVNRLPKYIKIKARTKRRLYTIKLYSEEEAQKILKEVKVEIEEY